MATPQQVKQRAAEINQMYAQRAAEAEAEAAAQQQQTEDSEAAEQPGEGSEPEQPANEQPANEQPAGEQPLHDGGSDQMAQMRSELDALTQRYRTLQGMVRQKEDENQRLNALLAQMHTPPEPAPQQESSGGAQSKSEAKDREDFGDDLVDMVRRVVESMVGDFGRRLSELENVSRQTQATTTQTAKERFEARLTQAVPDWQELDRDPEFTEWLNSSQTRVEIARNAMKSFDASAIVELFEMFKALKRPTGGNVQPAEAPRAQKSLEQKVAPSKGRTSTPTSSTEKKQWTRTEIAQVFNNRRSYSQKEFDELQRDIFAAQKEGRVDYAR